MNLRQLKPVLFPCLMSMQGSPLIGVLVALWERCECIISPTCRNKVTASTVYWDIHQQFTGIYINSLLGYTSTVYWDIHQQFTGIYINSLLGYTSTVYWDIHQQFTGININRYTSTVYWDIHQQFKCINDLKVLRCLCKLPTFNDFSIPITNGNGCCFS